MTTARPPKGMLAIDPDKVPESPSWVIDLAALEDNLKILADVQAAAGCKILLALKGYAAWSTFPLIGRYLVGCTSSSPHEARLAREKMNKEVHAYAPAYSDADMDEIVELCDHIVFNSFNQWRHHKAKVLGSARKISCGIRVNPEHREAEVELYDPCARFSRLGTTRAQFQADELDGIDGLHFHNLCQLNSDSLERTLRAVEEKFGEFIPRMKWINFGGGHHITRPDYDRERLVRVIKEFKARYPHVEVYLEPGEAIAIRTGVLVATVMDIIENGMPLAILDTSATAHMPDVLEMPYRPDIVDGGLPQEKPYTYRLGGLTCLACDVIGDYSFDQPLQIGQRIVLLDMSHYTMVKTSTFNGVRLPSIATHDP
ncbi:MAG: carboxynorspermidine decarboxylase, partial [Pseudobdellovibrionaceae bacterium]|nr:carboxynorspermidine decarboxylase [Pseudobdellovibrionaceae bacterium]